MSAEYSAITSVRSPIARRGETRLAQHRERCVGIIFSNPAMTNKPMRVLGYIEWDSAVLPLSAPGRQRIFVACSSWGLAFACRVKLCNRFASSTPINNVGRRSAGHRYGYEGFVCSTRAILSRSQRKLSCIQTLHRAKPHWRGSIVTLRQLSAAWWKSQEMWEPPLLLAVCWSVRFSQHGLASAVSYYAKFFATGGTDILRWNPTGLPIVMTIDEFMG